MAMGLMVGEEYVVDDLVFAGWSDGQTHAELCAWDFFTTSGRYLGPDEDGLEPEFGSPEPASARRVRRRKPYPRGILSGLPIK
jgi:hypothetical protein